MNSTDGVYELVGWRVLEEEAGRAGFDGVLEGVFAVGVPVSETEADNYQLYAALDTGRKPFLTWEYSAGSNVDFRPEPVITLGERHLISWTKDAATKVVRCYIDGCCVLMASYTKEPTGGGSAVTAVGRSYSTSTAVLGHIAFWSGTVLSQERIQAHAVSAGVMYGITATHFADYARPISLFSAGYKLVNFVIT